MLKRLAALTVLAVGSFTAANAATFGGAFAATGTDMFTTNTIMFVPGTSFVTAGTISGDFAAYLNGSSPVTFLPGALPYVNGTDITPPNPPYTLGYVPLFTVTGTGGEVFTFNMTDYSASYIVGSNATPQLCLSGSTCLDASGHGFFTATGPLAGTSGPGSFAFTSQYVVGQPLASFTSFSASAGAVPQSPVPEPASLALVGSGLLGAVGVLRRRFAA